MTENPAPFFKGFLIAAVFTLAIVLVLALAVTDALVAVIRLLPVGS